MTALFSFSRQPKEALSRSERGSIPVPESRPQTQEHPQAEKAEITPKETSAPEGNIEDTISTLTQTLKKSKRPVTTGPIVRDALTKEVENIMADGLQDTYKNMTAIQRQEFKMKGEEVAVAIRELLTHTKVKIKKIFVLVFEWLKLIPGVNIFFLEQEAKIKAERIMRLHEMNKHRRP